jgi:ATP-dependent Clp endopeptidase proteolytic subunit ClpP
MKLSRPYNFKRPADATPRTWFRIRNEDKLGRHAELSIYDEIGAWGIAASDFVSELQGLTTDSITLRINSPGGDVWDGLAILNSLRNHRATVNVVIDGLAASAASFIAMAGDTVVMSPNSVMMIHEASGLCLGNAADMRELADLLDKTSANIADIYSRKTGRPASEHRAAMRNETWYSDQEAVDAGLADSVLGSEPETKNSAPAVVVSSGTTWDDVFAHVDFDQLSTALKGVRE